MMNKDTNNATQPQESIFRGVLLAYFVLFLHVILILGLAAVVLLFGGIVTYLPWVLATGAVLVVVSGYLWWKHIKRQGRQLRDILKEPVLQGRTVEVSFLGGLASVRFGPSQELRTITHENSDVPKQLQGPKADRAEQLAQLAHLLKQDLITIDEYLKVKREIIGQ
jgi:hypothetical protein